MWTNKIKDFANRRRHGYTNHKSLNAIRGSFRDSDQLIRIKAIDGLYEVARTWKKQDPASYKSACGAFVLALKDPSVDVRLRCVERLKALAADPDFPEPGLLMLALRDPCAEVRELSARACLTSGNLPLIMQGLKSSDGEVRSILASGIGEDIHSRLQKIDMYDRWSQGLHSARGKPAPSSSPEDRALYLRDKAMEEQMLRYTSNAIVGFLKTAGTVTLADEVFAKALRIYRSSDPLHSALYDLLFALVNGDPVAVETALNLLHGGDPEKLLQPYMNHDSIHAGSVSPRCDTCNKELEALDLSGVAESLLTPSSRLFDGVVCTACRKVECSPCKSWRKDDSCKWCGRQTTFAHAHLL